MAVHGRWDLLENTKVSYVASSTVLPPNFSLCLLLYELTMIIV